ncbi:hypothetical protein PX699_02765 [Sphingobium sp. H39-3-25]|uniref:hypothetical protein n=1 Tax=Sphingobium arseniciresistens TaxID=3030834 RepID=UPI0023B94FB1|nr:hypothetical protein [Sphingobium arseniciresistens]
MRDIDNVLRRLSEQPVHPGLVEMDGAVMDALRARRAGEARPDALMMSLAVVAALGIGFAGSTLPRRAPQRIAASAPFGAPSALAPSTLLGEPE